MDNSELQNWGGKKKKKIAGDFIALHRLIERAVLVAWRQLDVMKL